jgi:chemotaxis protein histidine kinase CheA
MKFMEKTDHGSEIKKILTEFEGLLDGLKHDHAAQNNLEMDLALEKLRKMYDHLLQWKNEPSLKPESHEEPLKEVHFVPAPEEVSTEEPDLHEKEPANELAVNEASTDQEDEPVDLKSIQPDPVKTGNIDLFSSFSAQREQKTDEDSAGYGMKESIVDQIQKRKIITLKEAIGINEKFFLLNELFSGNLGEYNKTVAFLDGFTTFDEAMTYLNEIQEKYKWNPESEALIQLIQFIERKLK